MARIESGARPSDVRHGAGHVLFVEGSTPETIDPVVLSGLLTKLSILVEPLGPARSLENVASAMHARHPNYYFLIDRDHRTTEVVEQSWREFPNERTSNLLIWRRRHLENYFLDVDYLALSQFVTCGKDQLIERIERAAAKRIYMEAANLVIIGIRETQKKSWIEKFDSCAGFESRDSGRSMLVGRPEFNIRLANVGVTLEPEAIAASYDSEVCDLLGGESVPVYGKGTWLHRMSGKDILSEALNGCLKVWTVNKTPIQGPDAIKTMARELVGKGHDDQPNDFRELIRLLTKVVQPI